ncbi:40S ribosomal protein S5-1 [Hordeum vulgare]|nr:40S ribosomal protein S5-1 [Hordeum vulgare]
MKLTFHSDVFQKACEIGSQYTQMESKKNQLKLECDAMKKVLEDKDLVLAKLKEKSKADELKLADFDKLMAENEKMKKERDEWAKKLNSMAKRGNAIEIFVKDFMSKMLASLIAPKDKIFEKVINPYLAGVLQHPQSIEMREGMLHIHDVEGPKKTRSVDARLESMEQQVFKCQRMVERGLNANHMMITEFTNKHKIDANDIGKHLSRLYDIIDHLQAQIYDLQNQNYHWLNVCPLAIVGDF